MVKIGELSGGAEFTELGRRWQQPRDVPLYSYGGNSVQNIQISCQNPISPGFPPVFPRLCHYMK